jgi:hypothetical protein
MAGSRKSVDLSLGLTSALSGMEWQDRFWHRSYGGFRRDLEEATMTPVRRVLGLFAAAALVTACPSQTQTLTNKQGAATEAVLQRGRFDLNCPSATPRCCRATTSSRPCRGRG